MTKSERIAKIKAYIRRTGSLVVFKEFLNGKWRVREILYENGVWLLNWFIETPFVMYGGKYKSDSVIIEAGEKTVISEKRATKMIRDNLNYIRKNYGFL